MNQHLKGNEKELVRLASFFKKKSQQLMEAGKLGEEHKKVSEAVDRFIAHLEQHANSRAFLQEQREQLNNLVKDNAACPQCKKRDMLKLAGAEKNEKNWKSNRYKCRRCNIAFTWNMPNNPWDMIAYIEELLETYKQKLGDQTVAEEEKQHLSEGMSSATKNLEKIKPVIETHDKEYNDFQSREMEMEKLVHEFKNSLMIEKIKLDTWENRKV